ncbi:MAG: hypothetical protein AAFR73_04975 [Pseudomonadota bacterium]
MKTLCFAAFAALLPFPLTAQDIDVLRDVTPDVFREVAPLTASDNWREDPDFPNTQFRNFRNGQAARSTVEGLPASGQEIEVRLTENYLREQRDRREDVYLVITVASGNGDVISRTTPVWRDLDEDILYLRNYRVFEGDPHGQIEISAQMFDHEGATASFIADVLKVISTAANVVATVSSGGTIVSIVGSTADIGEKIVRAVGELGDDDFYGDQTVSWTGNDVLTAGTERVMTFFEPDTGTGDRGHDIDVTFVIREVEPDDDDGPPTPICPATLICHEP